MTATEATAPTTRAHPLLPLTEEDIAVAVDVVRTDGVAGPTTTFHRAALHEPEPDELDRHERGGDVDRRVALVLWDHDRRLLTEAVVSVTDRRLVSRREVPGARPVPGLGDFTDAGEIALADDGVRAALAARGVTDTTKVQVDPWPTGNFGLPYEQGRRVSRCVFFYRELPTDNGYSRPIDGLMAHVDHDERRVVHITDIGIWPVPEQVVNYDAESVGAMRTDLRPIEITQPEGVSFTVDGNEISWQRWRLRTWLDHTEGLVLGSVTYDDGGRPRSILRRASLAEMVVPYGETRPTQAFKNALDAGEIGLGRLVNSLELGCDCLGEITYLDAVFATEQGEPYRVSNAICIHEEDYGVLWKHFDLQTLTAEVRRSRRLVVSSIHTAGNYEYGFFWHLYQDGTIELMVKLTGCLTPMGYREGDDLSHASLIAAQVAAPIHQHLFCYRLDVAVDGTDNSIYEVDVVPDPPGPDNPLNNAFRAVATRLETASGAVRDPAPELSRTWRIVNERTTNGLGQHPAYRLHPGPLPRFLPGPESSIASRAAFGRHAVWVTPSRSDERFAAGPYPVQSEPDGAGLPAWAGRDEPVADTDITLWHSFGVTHVPRPEDFPVMPVEYVAFQLMPFGFFDRNPALDVPPSHTNGSHCST